jgi:type I restriction enzyme S subunit
MSEWKIAKLTEVAAVFNGKTPSKIEQRTEGHPVLKIKDVSELGEYRGKFESFVDPELAAKFANKQVQEGDTLILNAAHNADYVASKTYHAQPPTFGALATGEWLIIRPDRKALDAKFAHHWVNSTRTRYELRELVNGIHLYPKDVARLQISLPSLEEQRRIAEILDRAEELRSKRREAIAELDTLIQAIFLEMFGNPVTNPKGWKIKICKSICSRITVGIVVQPASYYQEYGVPALRSQNIKQNSISTDNLVFFSQSDNETKLAKTRVKAGDVVLVRTGQPGTAAVIPEELDGVNAIDLLITTPCKDVVDSVYLCSFFNSAWGKKLVSSSQVGQIQKHLNVGILNNAQIICPPLPLQQEFAHRAEAVEKLKAAHRASLSELDALFASLQHRAFRGEL